MEEEWGEGAATTTTYQEEPAPTNRGKSSMLLGARKVKDSNILDYFKREPPQLAGTTPEQSERVTIITDTGSEESKTGGGLENKCTFDDQDICLNHGCKGTRVKISTTKWRWKPKSKEYGNVKCKIEKIICKARNQIPVEPEISTNIQVNLSKQRHLLPGVENNFGSQNTGGLSDILSESLPLGLRESSESISESSSKT